MSETLVVETARAVEHQDITDRVREVVKRSGVTDGLCHVMALHSTAAVIVNETDDPNIGRDVARALDRAVPQHAGWLHDRIDANAHSHIKASLLGPAETLPVSNGDLLLGTWQRLILMEFDGPRTRKIHVHLLGN